MNTNLLSSIENTNNLLSIAHLISYKDPINDKNIFAEFLFDLVLLHNEK